MKALVNGTPVDALCLLDRGLHYGDGLFETIAILNGKPMLWDRHMQRLNTGCLKLQLDPPDTKRLRDEVAAVSAHSSRAAVKIILTRGPGGHGYRRAQPTAQNLIVMLRDWPEPLSDPATNGVAVRWCQLQLSRQPALAGIKHLNRLEQVLARGEWTDDYAEGLLCDTDGNVIEGTMSNLFIVRGGTLQTPDLSESGVAGVVRAEILDMATQLGIRAEISRVRKSDVASADELFLTNSLIGIWPVTRLESKSYVVGQITQTLQKASRLTG